MSLYNKRVVLSEGMCDDRKEMLKRVAKDETDGKISPRVGALDSLDRDNCNRVHQRRGLKSCSVSEIILSLLTLEETRESGTPRG